MKKICIISVLFIVGFHFSSAQCFDTEMDDVYTPMGNHVVTWLTCEASTAAREYYDNYYNSRYPNAEMIITYDNLSEAKAHIHIIRLGIESRYLSVCFMYLLIQSHPNYNIRRMSCV